MNVRAFTPQAKKQIEIIITNNYHDASDYQLSEGVVLLTIYIIPGLFKLSLRLRDIRH